MAASMFRETFRHARTILWSMLACAVFVYLLSGFYSVKPEESGVVSRFGKVVLEDVPPGIHYHWPWPFESVERPVTKEVRNLNLVFERTNAPGEELSGGVLLTGDENIVRLTLNTQYTIESPKRFLYTTQDPAAMLTRLLQSATVRLFAGLDINDILTTGRNTILQKLKKELQTRVDVLALGLRINSLHIQSLDPPLEVAGAFLDVASAREDSLKMRQEANGDLNRRLPEARAKAEQSLREAESGAAEARQMASGDAEKFVATWEEYRKAPDVTAQRLYLETIETVLPLVKKQIINPKAEQASSH